MHEIMNGEKIEKNKHFRTVEAILQSCLIVLLIILVVFMMLQINKLQGTARVINYTGLVRGATQRLVKLEIAESPNDELILYLDEVLEDLKYGDGYYRLVSLDDSIYQQKLDNLMLYWSDLKNQIILVRRDGYGQSDKDNLLEMSEVYFELADATVSSAEIYSDKIAKRIEWIEIISAVDMFLLLCIIAEQTYSAVRMRRKNKLLEQKAYIDMHTGLQNKNMCQEILADRTIITEPTACLMFDMNNLKRTNDTFGHLAGDKLIADFAHILKSVIREHDFAGRCGGDEFMVILYEIKPNTVTDVLQRLSEEVQYYNNTGEIKVPISFASGWAVSMNYKGCTNKILFSEADRCMYENKQKMKREKQKTAETVS